MVLILHLTIIPLKIYLTGSIGDEKKAMLKISWGLARIKAQISQDMMLKLWIEGIKIIERPASSLITDETDKKSKENGGEDKKPDISLDMIVSFKPELQQIFNLISFESFYAKIKFGLNDPADTGVMYGFLMALRGILYSQKKIVMEIYPDFEGLYLRGKCESVFQINHIFRIFIPSYRLYKKAFSKKPKKKRPAGEKPINPATFQTPVE